MTGTEAAVDPSMPSNPSGAAAAASVAQPAKRARIRRSPATAAGSAGPAASPPPPLDPSQLASSSSMPGVHSGLTAAGGSASRSGRFTPATPPVVPSKNTVRKVWTDNGMQNTIEVSANGKIFISVSDRRCGIATTSGKIVNGEIIVDKDETGNPKITGSGMTKATCGMLIEISNERLSGKRQDALGVQFRSEVLALLDPSFFLPPHGGSGVLGAPAAAASGPTLPPHVAHTAPMPENHIAVAPPPEQSDTRAQIVKFLLEYVYNLSEEDKHTDALYKWLTSSALEFTIGHWHWGQPLSADIETYLTAIINGNVELDPLLDILQTVVPANAAVEQDAELPPSDPSSPVGLGVGAVVMGAAMAAGAMDCG